MSRFDYTEFTADGDSDYPEFKIRNGDTDRLPAPVAGSKLIEKDVQNEDGTWRKMIVSTKVKFDDAAKRIFLSTYSKIGRWEHSANMAGVTGRTVHNHLDSDQEFAEAFSLAQGMYRDKVIGHTQNLIFNGTDKENFDRNGNLVSREKVYPIRLIELELKKVDEGYRDRREVDVTVGGGVMVTPSEVNSISEWEKKFGPGAKIVEAEAVESADGISDVKADGISEDETPSA